MKKTPPGLTKHLAKAQKVAISAALEAGELLRKKFGKHRQLDRKKDSSLVTEADRGAEKIVVSQIKKHFPSDEILGEESGFSKGRSLQVPKAYQKFGSFRWHIDPLDGTTNFVHAFPMFCVSIGLEFENATSADDLVLGVIYNPITKDLYTAYRGSGATRNGKPIHVSKNSILSDAVLTTGFSYRRDAYYDRELHSFSKILRESRALRRIGSAALDLSFVSSGQFDGFWERGLNSWDVAAGICILTEAGGKVTKIDGSPYKLGDDSILATNSTIHSSIMKLIGSSDR